MGTLVTDQDGSYNNGHELYGIQIYPACGGSLASGDVSTIVAKNRRNALAGGSYENWEQMGGSEHFNGDDTWPVTIGVINDVRSNVVTVTFSSATQELECLYWDSFDQDTDTVFGMIGDANAEGEQGPVHMIPVNQGPFAGIGGSEDVNAEPFSIDIMLSAKDLVIVVLAAMTVILMVIVCANRKGGFGMSRQYKVVSV